MSAPPSSPEEKSKPITMSPAGIERIKLTAIYMNTCAASLFTVGVAAPSAAAVFGLGGATYPFNSLTLAVGMPIFLLASVALHMVARRTLKGLKS